MKFPALLFTALSLCVPATLPAAPADSFRDAEIVPVAGEYAVLVSEKTLAKKDWKAVADKFLKRYSGTLVKWQGNDVASAKDALKKLQPRYVAVVAEPEEIDRVFVAKLHRISREMNDDVYGDFLWGIVTGKDAASAGTLLAKDKPLILDRALGTTNFDQRRFKKSFFITDWGEREFIETENYVSGEKTNAKPGEDMIEIFAERWKKNDPQFLISASHATEYNLEMPFGEGLIASAGTDFYLVPKHLLPAFAARLGSEAAQAEFFKTKKLKTLPKTPAEKIWIASGNCLFGDVLRSPRSMAVTAISSANVKQLVGYTVPSWFGEGGWGTSGQFFGGHQATSVGQAWFFNNQILLKNLPESATRADISMQADGMEGLSIEAAMDAIFAAKQRPTRELLGRIYDRDTVAFYGDPLYRARFNPDAPSTSPWLCKVSDKGKNPIFTLKTVRKDGYKGDFCLWFPKKIELGKGLKTKSSDKKRNVPAPDILTENFVIFRDLEVAPDETLTFSASVKK